MSIATIKRRITAHQKRFGKSKGLSATKLGSLLKKQISIKTTSWNKEKTGFCEIYLVAHCGGSLLGNFIYTLQSVDIKTTWTERVATMGKWQNGVFTGIKKIEQQQPFNLFGIDSDNGSEFINHQSDGYTKNSLPVCSGMQRAQLTLHLLRNFPKIIRGELAERSNATVLKTVGLVRVPRVRIPHSPP